jgi:hypothetical protein
VRRHLRHRGVRAGLGNDTGGPEFGFPVAQVAVIDFVGGQPHQTELAQLPSSGHLLTLRNGTARRGTFVNMIEGTTVVWKNENGQTERIPMTDVNRVYLNPQSARVAFNYNGPSAATAGAVGTAGQVAAPAGSVQVKADQAWTDGGITVERGDRVSFNTTGQINFGSTGGMTAGPDGNDTVRKQTYPVPAMPVGGLIGRVGTNPPFPIGSNSQPIVMNGDGRLMLGINDDELGDNSGAFIVTVTKVR